MDMGCLSDAPSADADADSEAKESDLGEGSCAHEADEDASADVVDGQGITEGGRGGGKRDVNHAGASRYRLCVARCIFLHGQERRAQGRGDAHVRPTGAG